MVTSSFGGSGPVDNWHDCDGSASGGSLKSGISTLPSCRGTTRQAGPAVSLKQGRPGIGGGGNGGPTQSGIRLSGGPGGYAGLRRGMSGCSDS
ncbi:MAG: hypothetical protein JWO93_2683 [Micrococcaceae bacterium]|nr:hypothetical protein [Micrococcaceae bacterium]